MSKTIIFILLSLATHPQVQACPFTGVKLGALAEDSRFQHLGQNQTRYPLALFKTYQDVLGEFSIDDCRHSVVANRYREKATGQVFTAFYTNDDSCDGGNSYGVIVRETSPHPTQAIAIIRDSNISCLK